MQKKTAAKIILDIVMAVVLISMFCYRAISPAYHEIGGIVLMVIFIAHVALNGPWVVSVLKRFREVPGRAKLQCILDIALAVAMLLILVSGLMIAKVVTIFSGGSFFWRALHIPVSYIALVLVGVHAGLAWHAVAHKCKLALARPIALGAAILLIIGGVAGAVLGSVPSKMVSFGGGAGHGGNHEQGAFPGGQAPSGQSGQESGGTPPSGAPGQGEGNGQGYRPGNGQGKGAGQSEGQGYGPGNGQGKGSGALSTETSGTNGQFPQGEGPGGAGRGHGGGNWPQMLYVALFTAGVAALTRLIDEALRRRHAGRPDPSDFIDEVDEKSLVEPGGSLDDAGNGDTRADSY